MPQEKNNYQDVLKAPSRKKAVAIKLFGGYVLSAITMIQGLVLIPLYLNYISVEMYGYWLTIFGLIGVISTINYGNNQVALQRMTRAYAEKNIEKFADYFSGNLLVYTFIVFTFFVVGGLIFFVLPMILKSEENLQLLEWCYLLAIGTSGISFFNEVLKGFSQSLLRPVFPMGSVIFGRISGIVMVIFLLVQEVGLLSIPLSLLFAELFIFVLNLVHVIDYSRRLKIRFQIKKAIIKEYLDLSFPIIGGTLGQKVSLSSPPLIITYFLGAELTTAYNLTKKVVDLILTIHNVFVPAILVPFSHMLGDSTKEKISQIATKILVFSFIISVSGFSTYIAANQYFVELWVGSGIVLPQNVIVFIGLGGLGSSLTYIFLSLLYGYGEFSYASRFSIVSSFLSVGLAFFLIPIIGIISIPISYFIGSAVNLVALYRRLIQLLTINLTRLDIAKIGITLVLIFIATALLAFRKFHIGSWFDFSLFILMYLFVIVIANITNYKLIIDLFFTFKKRKSEV